MTAHDAAEVRRVLRENGHEIGDRGKLSQANLDLYDSITGGTVTDDDFGPDNTGPGHDGDGDAEQVQAEKVPGSIKTGAERDWTRRGMAGTRRRLFGTSDTNKKPRRRRTGGKSSSSAVRDRLPVAPLLERGWLELAHSARAIPPLQRVLAAQAPMAGIVLEDATRDTIADRAFLQPMARQEDRLEAFNAMLGAPLWTGLIVRFGAIELEQAHDEKGRNIVGTDGTPVMTPVIDPATGRPAYDDRTRIMIGGLRLSLMSWLKISRANAEDIKARAAEMNELSDQADELIAWILSPPDDSKRFADVQREAREYAQTFVYRGPGPSADGPVPQPGPAPVPAVSLVPAAQAAAAATVTAPDPRSMRFMPPDAHIASQVVPRAPMPQGLHFSSGPASAIVPGLFPDKGAQPPGTDVSRETAPVTAKALVVTGAAYLSCDGRQHRE